MIPAPLVNPTRQELEGWAKLYITSHVKDPDQRGKVPPTWLVDLVVDAYSMGRTRGAESVHDAVAHDARVAEIAAPLLARSMTPGASDIKEAVRLAVALIEASAAQRAEVAVTVKPHPKRGPVAHLMEEPDWLEPK